MTTPTDHSFSDAEISLVSACDVTQGRRLQACVQGNETPRSHSQPEGSLLPGESWYETVFRGRHTFPPHDGSQLLTNELWPLSVSEPATAKSEAAIAGGLSTVKQGSQGRVTPKRKPPKLISNREVNRGTECDECRKRKSACMVLLRDPLKDCLDCRVDPDRKCNRFIILRDRKRESSRKSNAKRRNNENNEE